MCSFADQVRSGPVIQDIKNQTVHLGGTIRVECLVLDKIQPEFNLFYKLSNGSMIPVQLGGRIKMEIGKKRKESVNECFFKNLVCLL
jgi:hypothetical protein